MNSNPIALGWTGTDGDGLGQNDFDGLLDEFAYYERVLTTAEISELYNSGAAYNPYGGYPYFTITSTQFQTYNATINGSLYQTTNGTINTAIEKAGGGSVDITIVAEEHFDYTYNSYDISSDISETNSAKYPYINLFDYNNDTQINEFNATINSTVYSTTNGTLFVPYNQTGLLTTFEVNDYLDRADTLSLNADSNDSSTIWQSEVNFQAFKLLNGLEVLGNFTIGSETKLTNETFRLSSGTYNVTFSSNGYYNKTEEKTIVANTNTSLNISGVYDSIITVTAWDSVGEEQIQEFDSILEAAAYGVNVTSNTTNGTLTFNAIQGVSYMVYIDSPTFALANESITPNNQTEALNITVEQTNSVKIYIYDVVSDALLNGTNVTISFILGNATTVNVTSTGYFYAANLTPGSYSVEFTATGYDKNTYAISVTNRSTQTLNAYLLSITGSNQAVFTMRDKITEQLVQEVATTIEKKISGVWTVINVLDSDITGRIQFSYENFIEYRFTMVATGYETKIFELDPIIFDSYNIWLDPDTSELSQSDYSRINIQYYPNIYYDDQNNTISLTFSSSEGEFEDYGFLATWENVSASDSGVNAYGETITGNIEINNADYGDRVILYYYYTLANGTTKEYTVPFVIQGTGYGDYTFNQNPGETYGLGLLERVLIVVAIALLVGGSAYLFTGAIGAGTMVMLIFGYLTKIGFISGWLTIPSMIILFIVTAWGASK